MNYARIYEALISKRRGDAASGYVERHHVVPRCLGGPNTKGNIVTLTAREHFVAHWLLAKIHGGRMWAALMSMSARKRYANGRLYSAARANWAAQLVGNRFGCGLTKSPETRAKIADAQRGAKNHRFGKRLTPEHAYAAGSALRGKTLTPEHRERIGAAQQGRKPSAETRQRMSEAARARAMRLPNPMLGKKRPDLAARNRARAGRG